MSNVRQFGFADACEISALCLVAYDTLLTLSREIQCVWRRKWGLVTVIFVLQRWIQVLDGVINMVPTTNLW
ncbi:hypothetical protein EIP91_009373 [Steccherinum ochraceum]|uniref:DUF6533 domain-containing protein n=1 Tax=Steccherinum ochraceum TaxID=92696 RepID=A0A4R0R1R0_9APHY|nr:hypothetical protein EIP91_009373 [Steccherinum ochraceum]